MSSGGESNVGATILIVDDVESNCLIMEEIIKDMKCQPILAESGEQALKLVEERHPQLVLTDISMPGMSGYELCRKIKENRATKNIPVIFISAFDDPRDIVEGFLLGGEDYITKPFIPEVVQARVGVHLRLYTTKRELMEMNRRLQVSVSEQLRQIEQEKKNILCAMANVAVKSLHYEENHIERLRGNCRVLAQGMQLSPKFEDKVSDTFIDTLELAAPLCDIGNLGVPREILQKQEDLTGDEAVQVQGHTDIGAEILRDLHIGNDYNDFISISVNIVRHHHENWDGSGYPDGLAGDEIPLAAQIVSVGERYCELTGEDGMGREEALEQMKKESGVKFNPDIMDIFCKISRQLA